MKFCKKCNADTERNKRGDCKPCARNRNSVYRSECAEKVKAKGQAYYADNKDTLKGRSSAWRNKNRNRVRAANLAWKAANPEKERSRKAAWSAANKDKVRIKDQNLRAKRRSAFGRLTRGISEKLFRLQRGKCACGCRQPLGDGYHLDHIMPLALGGTNTDDNVQLLRATCNLQKHAKHPIDFMQQRGFLL